MRKRIYKMGQLILEETPYHVTSANRRRLPPKKFLRGIRGHWQEENTLHHVKDRSWNEDKMYSKVPEIGQYTPYRQVKTILLDRFHRRLEAEPSATVPGRTLDTAVAMHPPSLSRLNIIAQREKSLLNRAVNQRAKRKTNTFKHVFRNSLSLATLFHSKFEKDWNNNQCDCGKDRSNADLGKEEKIV